MSTKPDADLTLASVIAALPEGQCEKRLVLTIVFHPDISRIGETAEIPDLSNSASSVLGRRSPSFARSGSAHAASLGEQHVSRRAISLQDNGCGLTLRRLPGSSRCSIAGRELSGSVELQTEQLQRGVSILLGHSVVLLLRLGARMGPFHASRAQLCGSSAYMNDLRKQISSLAEAGMDVLIRGETGTGKELVADAIHRCSNRSGAPLVSINMAAIPPGLAAATLFGSARGAFTGATRANEGYFVQAHGGTLFLDEIADTPAEVQPQLLRALQEREIQAVGGAIRRVDVRVISATDGRLEGDSCDFRSALRHRLGAAEILLLPLRYHPEDVGELLLHFLTLHCRQLQRAHLLPVQGSPARKLGAWAALFNSFVGYQWPGNVRELANYAGQVVVASEESLSVPDAVRYALEQPATDNATPNVSEGGPALRSIREVDSREFDTAMRASAYEVANVARQLGVSRQAVYRRMDESPMHRLAGQVPEPELEQALLHRAGDARAAALDLKVSASGLRSRLRDSSLLWF